MHTLFRFVILTTLLLTETFAQASDPIMIASGSPLVVIERAIEKAHAQGGGTIVLGSGVYKLEHSLNLSDKQNVTLLGEEKVVLKAAAQQVTQLSKDVEANAIRLQLEKPMNITAGMRVEIHSPGRKVVSPTGTTFQTPYIMASVERVEGTTLYLSQPIKHAAPKGEKVIAVFNGIIIRGNAKNLTIQNITLDMNRSEWPIVPKNHTYQCALIAQGPYSYDKGPSGSPVSGLRIIGCTIKNAHQRGIAFYSVVHSDIYDCHIENTGAEGIDFDHFTYHCQAVSNTLVDCHNIELNDASNCLIANNQIIRPSTGVVVWQWCTLPGLNERNLILNNKITDSKGDGISLRRGADFNIVRGNTVHNSARDGIVVEGNCNIITGNTVQESKKEDIKITGEENAFRP